MNKIRAADAIIECDACSYEFPFLSVKIKEATVQGVSDMTIRYFTCPKCGKLYPILLMDQKYRELLNDFVQAKLRYTKALRKPGNVGVASMLGESMMRKKQRLSAHHENIRRKYPGTFTIVSSEGNEDIINYLP